MAVGQQIDFLYNLTDDNGDPLDGVVVEFYRAGTTTPVVVWANSDCTGSLGSSITLNTRGSKHCFNDGEYALKIVVKDPAGDITYDGMNYKNYTGGSGSLPSDGGTLTGDLNMNSNDINNVDNMYMTSNGQIIFKVGGSWTPDVTDMLVMGDSNGYWAMRGGAALGFYDDGVLKWSMDTNGNLLSAGGTVSGLPSGSATGHAVEYDQWAAKNALQDAEILAISSSYSRRKKVIAIAVSTSAPPTEAIGNRYILDTSGTPHANWDGASQNDIVEFNGATWDATTPVEGYIAYVDDVNKDALFVDDGTPAWELRDIAVTDHNDLSNKGTNTHAQIDSFISDAVGGNFPPTGSVSMFGAGTAPTGWVLCDGSSLDTTTYADLFAVIGYAYGGSGANFNVPNCKGNVIAGFDATQSEFDSLGKTGGAKTDTLSIATIPSHGHSGGTGNMSANHTHDMTHGHEVGGVASDNATANGDFAAGSTFNSVPQTEPTTTQDVTTTGEVSADHNHSILSEGGGGAHNNIQPYITMNYIIKT